MARYFRCEESGQQCPHALTREVQIEHEGVCPIDKSDCARYRQTVPWWIALRERHPGPVWGGLGLLVFTMVALLLWSLLGGGGWQGELSGLRTELTALDSRLHRLEGELGQQPTPKPDPRSWERLAEEVQRFKQSVDQAVATNADQGVQPLQREADSLQGQFASLRVVDGTDPGAGNRRMMARQLARDYESLETHAEGVRSKESDGNEVADESFSGLIEQTRVGMRRAQRLAAPPPDAEAPAVDAALAGRIEAELASGLRSLEQLSNKPQPPFKPTEAGLAIAANPTLAESLMLPLLQARFSGSLTSEPVAKRWFFATADPAIAPGAVIVAASDDAYGMLIEGSADLVLTQHPPDDAIRARFASTYPGQELDSRAFSEVIALDAVALLAHPSATVSPVDLAELAEGPWLVRASDAPLIRRLTGQAVTIKEVPDPFEPLLAGAKARALVLYHQCKPNLPIRYLPFRPGAEARVLAPSPFSIGTEDYRLAFRIIAALSPQSRPAARQFIEYLTSDPGQERIAAAGFVDLRLSYRQEVVDPTILATLAEALGRKSISNASRYSTNLRFGVDRDELDIKAQADIGRLPRSLAASFPDGKVVILGFTDNTGSAEHNHRLSIRRAEYIVRMLQQFGIGAVSAGLGRQFPIDSNDTEEGRARNRRTEVWVVNN